MSVFFFKGVVWGCFSYLWTQECCRFNHPKTQWLKTKNIYLQVSGAFPLVLAEFINMSDGWLANLGWSGMALAAMTRVIQLCSVSLILQRTSLGLFFSLWQKRTRVWTEMHKCFHKPLPVSNLVTSHWPRQIKWWIPESRGETECPFQNGRALWSFRARAVDTSKDEEEPGPLKQSISAKRAKSFWWSPKLFSRSLCFVPF